MENAQDIMPMVDNHKVFCTKLLLLLHYISKHNIILFSLLQFLKQ